MLNVLQFASVHQSRIRIVIEQDTIDGPYRKSLHDDTEHSRPYSGGGTGLNSITDFESWIGHRRPPAESSQAENEHDQQAL